MKNHFLIFLFALFAASASIFANNSNYALVVDAGSSGSRIFLMQYTESRTQLAKIHIVKSQKIKPGIATLVNEPEGLSKYLSDLFESVLESYQLKGNKIPVIFHMTAGARLLKLGEQSALISQVRSFLDENHFRAHDVEIISGEDEGVFSWLSINYLYGTLTGAASKSLDAIELGGASAQLVISHSRSPDSKNGQCLFLNQQHYEVNSKSFLGLGNDEAHENWKIEACKLGAANAADCRAAIQENLLTEFPLESLHMRGNFVALGYYHYLFEELEISEYNDEAMIEMENFLCSHSMQKIAEEYPLLKSNTLKKACFDIIYTDELLKHFGAKDKSSIQIHDSSKQYYTWAYASLLFYLENRPGHSN